VENINITQGDYLISTDKTKIDVKAIHDFLSNHRYTMRDFNFHSLRLVLFIVIP
jgi:hypothetical protein